MRAGSRLGSRRSIGSRVEEVSAHEETRILDTSAEAGQMEATAHLLDVSSRREARNRLPSTSPSSAPHPPDSSRSLPRGLAGCGARCLALAVLLAGAAVRSIRARPHRRSQ